MIINRLEKMFQEYNITILILDLIQNLNRNKQHIPEHINLFSIHFEYILYVIEILRRITMFLLSKRFRHLNII